MHSIQTKGTYNEDEDLGVYSKQGREEKIEEDAIKTWEDGIMLGYEEDAPEWLEDEDLDEIYTEEVQ